jgi:formylglycine-generating enzyme required for sulfatase activity
VNAFPYDASPYGVIGLGGNVSEFVGYAATGHMAYRGGSFADPVIDAQIHIETQLPLNSRFTWAFVGFRAVRPTED